MDKKSPDVRYICRISGWDFKHLAVRGGSDKQYSYESVSSRRFQSPLGEGVVQTATIREIAQHPIFSFQSPRGVGVVQTAGVGTDEDKSRLKFQSPRGVGVVQTANPRTRMVMRQTGI